MIKTNKMPSINMLKDRFYLSDSGVLIHKKSIGGVQVGSEAGHATKNGYRRILIKGKKYNAHRIIFFMRTGIDPLDMEVDHINGDRSDNSEGNLRLATRKQNGRNRALNSNNKLGIKGVYWCSRDLVYKAFIKVNGNKINLGSYSDAETASKAYQEAAKKYFSDFKRGFENE